MYNILKTLFSKKLLFIIAIFQLSFGFSLLNYSLSLINTNENKLSTIESLYKADSTYRTEVQTPGEATPNYGPLRNVISDLDNLKNQGFINDYVTHYSYPFLGFNTLEEKLFGDTLDSKEREDFFHSPITIINESFYKRASIKTIKGRPPTSSDFYKDFTQENIPLWLGKNFENKVSIGDTFLNDGLDTMTTDGEISIKELTFEVVGILDHYQIPTIHGDENLREKLAYTDNVVLIPSIPNFFDYNSEVALNDFGLFVELPSSTSLEEYEKKILEICNKYDFAFKITPFTKDFSSKTENLTRELYQSLFIGVILTFLSLVCIISILLGNINDRKAEFGIKLSSGASLNTLIKEIIFEVLIIVIFSIIISFLILYFRGITIQYTFKFISIILAFILIIIFTITTPLVLKLRKFNTIDLIRK
ncbi:MAG: FtsX-like permease family protein [Clostridium sp.]